MIELFDGDRREEHRQSSKGNQLKWLKDDIWYKADYTGYEGLAEYVISGLLRFSDLKPEEYVHYDTEEIHYGYQTLFGCRSENILPKGWQMITLERLFQSFHGQSLNRSLYLIGDHEKRLSFLVDQIRRITKLEDFGGYMSKLRTLDALFLNEDRHTHNIAVLMDREGEYHYCPFFDHGAALLSDTKMDYPLNVPADKLIGTVRAKTFCDDFDEQLDIAEKLYGQQVRFGFAEKDIDQLLAEEMYYPAEIKARVKDILLEQRRKYQYLWNHK